MELHWMLGQWQGLLIWLEPAKTQETNWTWKHLQRVPNSSSLFCSGVLGEEGVQRIFISLSTVSSVALGLSCFCLKREVCRAYVVPRSRGGEMQWPLQVSVIRNWPMDCSMPFSQYSSIRKGREDSSCADAGISSLCFLQGKFTKLSPAPSLRILHLTSGNTATCKWKAHCYNDH